MPKITEQRCRLRPSIDLSRHPEQAEIRPERAAQEGESAQLDGLVLQEMNVRAAAGGAQFVQGGRQALVVELVVAGHENDGLIGELFAYPRDALHALVDVARQNNDVRFAGRDRARAKLTVQITQDAKKHGIQFDCVETVQVRPTRRRWLTPP